MTKTYDQLIHDADIEDFVSDAGVPEVKTPSKRRKKKKVEIVENALRGTFKINQRAEPREDKGFVGRRLEKRGDFEEVQQEEGNLAEGAEEERSELDDMWFGVGQRFGDPLKFVGSPFEKAKQVLATAENSQEWLEQAEQMVEQMTDVKVEKTQEVEETAEITREK